MKAPKKRIQRLAEDAEALWADGYRKGYRAGQTAARGGPRVTRGPRHPDGLQGPQGYARTVQELAEALRLGVRTVYRWKTFPDFPEMVQFLDDDARHRWGWDIHAVHRWVYGP